MFIASNAFLTLIAQAQAPGMLDTLVPVIAFVVIMWVLMIRPQQKKQRELMAKIASLKTGDKIVTTGGVHGVVTNVKEGTTFTLKVDDNCKLTIDKSAVAYIKEPPKEA